MNRIVGDRMREAVINTNIGEALYRMNEPARAIEVLRKAEEISTSLGDRILEGEILRGLAKAHMMTKDIATARDLVKRSIALFEQAKGKAFLGMALRTAGEIEAAGGWGGEGHAQASDFFQQSIFMFEELGNDAELARSCMSYADFLASDPDSKSDPIRLHEVNRLRSRADEIMTRIAQAEPASMTANEPHDLPGENTDPGVGHA